MQGIQSLMPQGPVPGQAPQQPMQGMMPKPGASTPPAQVKFLETKPSQELRAMYDQQPSLALLTAYTKAVEREKLNASMRGQQAVQQAVGAPATIADSIMQQPVMAAYGGEMHGYAGGGAVSFRHGGDVQKFSLGADEFGVLANPEAEAMDALRVERAQKERQAKVLEDTYYSLMMQGDPRAAQVKQQLDAIYGRAPVTPSAVASGPTRQGKSGIADLDIGPSMAPLSRTGVAAATTQKLVTGQPQQRPQTVPGKEVGAAELAAMQQGISNQASGIRTLSEPSDEERFARQQARQADIARLEEEKKVAREFREGASKQYADVERQVNLPFLENTAAIAQLGAAISGRKGETARGILQGIGGIEANKQARLDAARKEMREDQRTAMQMDSVNRQLSVAQQEKAYADMRGDREGSLAAAEKIAALTNAQNKLAYDYKIKQEELRNEGIKAQAAMLSAGKPSEMELALSRPEDYKRVMEMRAQAQQLKKDPAQVRADTLERYADNWEKLDMMQKNELAKQGISNFQQYTRMRDQMAGVGGAPTGGKTMSMADIQATASSSGKTPEEVRKAAIAAGYTIQ